MKHRPSSGTHPPLQLPLVLLLHLQLVVELLLQPLLGELDLPDGSFVLQPPLASCGDTVSQLTGSVSSKTTINASSKQWNQTDKTTKENLDLESELDVKSFR